MKPQDGTRDFDVSNLHQLESLISAGRYTEASVILEEEHARQSSAGNSIEVELLGVAKLICLACRQSHVEKDWYRMAVEAAGSREGEMRQQLRILLELMRKNRNPDPDSGGDNAREDNHIHDGIDSSGQTVFRLIQSLIPDRHMTVQSVEAPMKNIPIPLLDHATNDRKPDLSVHCLGRFRVYADSKLIGNWSSLKGKSIFKYLINHHKAPVSKEILMDLFWPDADQESARRSLHQAIYQIRHAFQLNQTDIRPIVFEDDKYGINPDLGIWLDFVEFESRCTRGRQLEQAGSIDEALEEYRLAEDLYDGEFLEEDPYEDWASRQRDQLKNCYITATDRLSARLQERGDLNRAIEYCQKILEKDDCYEAAYRRLMQCHHALGQPGIAVRNYQLCIKRLKEQLGVSPSRETHSIYQSIAGSDPGLGMAGSSGL